jgi:hypothetical protein
MRKPLSPEMIEESAQHALHVPAPVSVMPQQVAATETARSELVEKQNPYKRVAMLLAAPFIGLAYAVLLPLIGMAMLLWTAGQALMTIPAARKVLMRVKDIALFVAAPFIGLVYAVMLPLVGITMLVSLGIKAWMTRPSKA